MKKENSILFYYTEKNRYFYKEYFLHQEHVNIISKDTPFGVSIVSIIKDEKLDFYRVFIRTKHSDQLIEINKNKVDKVGFKSFHHKILRSISSSFSNCKWVTIADPAIKDSLLHYENLMITKKFKFGILLALDQQFKEEDMFSNGFFFSPSLLSLSSSPSSSFVSPFFLLLSFACPTPSFFFSLYYTPLSLLPFSFPLFVLFYSISSFLDFSFPSLSLYDLLPSPHMKWCSPPCTSVLPFSHYFPPLPLASPSLLISPWLSFLLFSFLFSLSPFLCFPQTIGFYQRSNSACMYFLIKEHGTPAFEEFLEFLGNKMELKGWTKFAGGLDVKSDTTGTHSLFYEFQDYEIMFHVSTLLPYSTNDPQQVERKRHLGNDIILIVFMDGKTPYSPTVISSNFIHVTFVIQPHKYSKDGKVSHYKMWCVSREGVSDFAPFLPDPPIFPKSADFREFLYTKCL